jgi:hypothetical protein
LEQNAKSSLTTLQATIVLGLWFDLSEMDVGSAYLPRAVAMANDLKLFEEATGIENNRMCNSSHFTAWCIFNWQR